jgi:hypothetical protein
MEKSESAKGSGPGDRRSHSADALQADQARGEGAEFRWHFGRVTRVGYYELRNAREVTIVWEEGGATSHAISDEQWEIVKLAFLTTGRIAILSDEEGEGWMTDYRFLEAVR